MLFQRGLRWEKQTNQKHVKNNDSAEISRREGRREGEMRTRNIVGSEA